ncbi:MAG: HupE/UreJ family protein [Gammaproteobacteria bacterium]|nr:HupE/UreJ family protein [Gammaproteobacteria bacterium]
MFLNNKFIYHIFIISTVILISINNCQADIVKPSLVEINVNTNETISIELRTSIEALLTGINSQYKNTNDAPNADKYDHLRKLTSDELYKKFIPFQNEFLRKIKLMLDNEVALLKIDKVKIPLPGYTKVPRTSIIYLSTSIPRHTKNLFWYYPQSFGDNAVRVKQIDEQYNQWFWSNWQWIRNDKMSEPFSLQKVFTQATNIEIISTYLIAGFEHIIPKGFDHLLFIIGIFLFSSQLRLLFWQVTMFTLAHTITLGLSTKGIIQLSSSIVEPLIALSIAFIAIENILKVKRDYVSSKENIFRMLIIFSFGLLHGMGFATMLKEFGLPNHAFYTALFSFNIGVEIAQLSVIIFSYMIFIKMVKTLTERSNNNLIQYNLLIVIPFSLVIACIGLYWTFDRLDIETII